MTTRTEFHDPDRLMIPAIIFDADDTLWETQGLYDGAKAQFFAFLAELGHDPGAAAAKFAEIDVQNVARFGFSRSRFPTSMRETYEFFCAAIGEPVRGDLQDRAVTIAQDVFDSAPVLRPDATEALLLLQPMYRLILFTAGDERVQWSRIRQSGIETNFDSVHVIPAKTVESWGDLLRFERLDPSTTWSIGNSVRSDINPAVQLGLRGVLVSAGFWEYERATLTTEAVWRVDTLREGAAVVLREDSLHLTTAGDRAKPRQT